MRKTKKLTLSSIMSALSVIFITLGSYFDALDLILGVLASVVMIFIYIELGSPYTWLVWLVSSTLAAILSFGNLLSVLWYFTLFGIYPILKAYIERLPRAVWLVPKLLYANAVFVGVVKLFELIMSTSPFVIDSTAMLVVIWVLGNVAFIAYDMLITVMAKLYLMKYRKRFSKFLK